VFARLRTADTLDLESCLQDNFSNISPTNGIVHLSSKRLRRHSTGSMNLDEDKVVEGFNTMA
jgi:hypothetical protein